LIRTERKGAGLFSTGESGVVENQPIGDFLHHYRYRIWVGDFDVDTKGCRRLVDRPDLDTMQPPCRLVNQRRPTGGKDQEGGKNKEEADPAVLLSPETHRRNLPQTSRTQERMGGRTCVFRANERSLSLLMPSQDPAIPQ